ncbi:MAG: amidohydrolase [Desulfobacterales bacterium]|nr:amidohydrolase [Desulfobacterales bacterium]
MVIEIDEKLQDWMVEIRRGLHMHPETAYEETRTTRRIAEILTDLGVEVRLFEDMTGVVGLLQGQGDGPTVGLRADIDALRLQELSDVPYKSRRDGVMHACGHDAHAAIMLGVARSMVESGFAREMRGAVKFLFQPAEEGGAGALKMIERGALEDPRVDWVLACHMLPEMEMGQVGVFEGQSHASADTYQLTITGVGAHGGRPHQGRDPIVAASHWVTAVQTVAGRNIDPLDSAVVTVGRFNSGDASNVIPARAELAGTTRAIGKGVRELVIQRVKEITAGAAAMFGVQCNLEFKDGYPPCVNDPRVSELMHNAANQALGPGRSSYMGPSAGAEDFAFFARERPAAIVRLGCGVPDKPFTPLHSPYFDIDERVLSAGVRLFRAAVSRLLTDGLDAVQGK